MQRKGVAHAPVQMSDLIATLSKQGKQQGLDEPTKAFVTALQSDAAKWVRESYSIEVNQWLERIQQLVARPSAQSLKAFIDAYEAMRNTMAARLAGNYHLVAIWEQTCKAYMARLTAYALHRLKTNLEQAIKTQNLPALLTSSDGGAAQLQETINASVNALVQHAVAVGTALDEHDDVVTFANYIESATAVIQNPLDTNAFSRYQAHASAMHGLQSGHGLAGPIAMCVVGAVVIAATIALAVVLPGVGLLVALAAMACAVPGVAFLTIGGVYAHRAHKEATVIRAGDRLGKAIEALQSPIKPV